MILNFLPFNNTYAIGDIHGCRKTLQKLVESLPLNSDSLLIFLGDYIDRGPDSKGVIDYLLELREKRNCLFLLGNHEYLMLDYLKTFDFKHWIQNGAQKTIESYGYSGGQFILPDDHLNFFLSNEYFIDTPDFLFVHGGVRPEKTITDNLKFFSKVDMLWERDHLKADHLNWEKTVVCGHTPRQQPIVKEKLIAIDTGCVYGTHFGLGNLTAIQLPSRKIFQEYNCE